MYKALGTVLLWLAALITVVMGLHYLLRRSGEATRRALDAERANLEKERAEMAKRIDTEDKRQRDRADAEHAQRQKELDKKEEELEAKVASGHEGIAEAWNNHLKQEDKSREQ